MQKRGKTGEDAVVIDADGEEAMEVDSEISPMQRKVCMVLVIMRCVSGAE